MRPTPISRKDAERRILSRWSKAIRAAEEAKMGVALPDWDRLRNYELENRMTDVFGGRWVINQWCPFNGIFCKWLDYAPRNILVNEIKTFEKEREQLTKEKYNVDYFIAQLQEQIDKRDGKKSRHEVPSGAPA